VEANTEMQQQPVMTAKGSSTDRRGAENGIGERTETKRAEQRTSEMKKQREAAVANADEDKKKKKKKKKK